MNKVKETKETYSLLWQKAKNIGEGKWHFDYMQEVIPESIVRGRIGLEVGSGCGQDAYIMAKNNPLVDIVSLEISDGIYEAQKRTSGFNNVRLIKGSALDIPIKNNVFDFAYSFGVLHHTPDPERGIKEIARVIKARAPVFLYVYEDHAGNSLKYYPLKFISALRRITSLIPAKMLYGFSSLLSPFIVLFFSYPARILGRFKATQPVSEKMPFNFGTHLFSLVGDLYDRFGAPIEHRFSRKEVFSLLNKNGFRNIQVGRLKARAGWVAWGIKTND